MHVKINSLIEKPTRVVCVCGCFFFGGREGGGLEPCNRITSPLGEVVTLLIRLHPKERRMLLIPHPAAIFGPITPPQWAPVLNWGSPWLLKTTNETSLRESLWCAWNRNNDKYTFAGMLTILLGLWKYDYPAYNNNYLKYILRKRDEWESFIDKLRKFRLDCEW